MKHRHRGTFLLLSAGATLIAAALPGCGGNGDSGGSTGLPGGAATRSQVLHGRYLVTAVADCTGCHQGNNNPNDPTFLSGYRTGGQSGSFPIGPFTTYAANLTQDKATGIGSWSAQDIFNALRNGKDPAGKYLCPPMPWTTFRNMTDDDIWSIAAYLQTLKPVTNKVPDSQGPPGTDGKPDWSSAYAHLTSLPAYPASDEGVVQ